MVDFALCCSCFFSLTSLAWALLVAVTYYTLDGSPMRFIRYYGLVNTLAFCIGITLEFI